MSGGDGSDASIGPHSPATANVTIASYQGRALPVPLGTAAVQGPWPTRSVDDAVVQQGSTTSGEQYVTRGSVSIVGRQSASPGTADGVGSPSIGNAGPGSSESIPPEVQLMARQITGESEDQAEMVQRLVNWFRSGTISVFDRGPASFPAGDRSGGCVPHPDKDRQLPDIHRRVRHDGAITRDTGPCRSWIHFRSA